MSNIDKRFDDSHDVVGRIKLHLFPTGKKLIPLTDKEQQTLEYVREVFTIWLSEPTKTDKQILHYIKNQFNLGEHPARRILIITKQILGNVQLADRKWHQHVFNESILKVIRRAEDQGNLQLQMQALEKYAKYNRLDKEIAEDIPWEKIIPPVTDFVADPTAAGLRPIENHEEIRRKLKRKYDLAEEAEEVDYSEEEEQEDGIEE